MNHVLEQNIIHCFAWAYNFCLFALQRVQKVEYIRWRFIRDCKFFCVYGGKILQVRFRYVQHAVKSWGWFWCRFIFLIIVLPIPMALCVQWRSAAVPGLIPLIYPAFGSFLRSYHKLSIRSTHMRMSKWNAMQSIRPWNPTTRFIWLKPRQGVQMRICSANTAGWAEQVESYFDSFMSVGDVPGLP